MLTELHRAKVLALDLDMCRMSVGRPILRMCVSRLTLYCMLSLDELGARCQARSILGETSIEILLYLTEPVQRYGRIEVSRQQAWLKQMGGPAGNYS